MITYHVDLTDIVAVLVAGALLMVPVVGITLRLVVPPIVESVARSRTIGSESSAAAAAPVLHRDAVTRAAELSVLDGAEAALRPSAAPR